MRLNERGKRAVTLRYPDNRSNDNKTYRWRGGDSIRAILQPMDNAIVSTIYGQNCQRMLHLLYDGQEKLLEGMGVCVEVAPDASCDFRIIRAQQWACQVAVLEWIPEARRI